MATPTRPASAARFEHPAALSGAPIDWPELARLLVVRPDNLGDVLMTGPALAALRAAAPHARIDLLAGPGGAAAGPLLPELDDVLVGRVSWQQLAPPAGAGAPDGALVAELRSRGYAAAVVLTSFSQSPWPAGYACQLAGIPVRAGLSKEFGGAGLTHWVPAPDDALHQVDRALYLLERLGVEPVWRTLRTAVPADARATARAVLERRGWSADDPYAVLLPGASCPARRYPADRFGAAARELVRGGLPVVVCGPASERELVRVVAGRDTPGVLGVSGELEAPGLAALLAGAAVVITNNSGGAHLADAVGTPVVVLFAGTELVEQYRPRSVPAVLLRVPTSCTPCRQLHCPFGLPCLDVPAREVAGAALRLTSSGRLAG